MTALGFVCEPQPWARDAACKGSTPTFFAEKGANAARRVALAKATCATCPVSSECLNYALDNRETFGVWGGLTVKERQRLIRSSPTVEIDMTAPFAQLVLDMDALADELSDVA